MSKIYNRDHIIYSNIKKKISIAVEQTSPSNNQVDKSLDISLTDENDLYFLFTAKIFASDFQRLKDQQGLLVEYNAFGQMLTELLTKCLAEENSVTPRYILQFSETCEPHVLEIVEKTDFRRLTHLAIDFVAASDETLKTYLVSYIKKIKAEYDLTLEKCRHKESLLSGQLASSSQMLNELKVKLEDSKESRQRVLSDLKNQYEMQLKNLTSSHEKTIELLTSKHSDELKFLQETFEKEITCLRSKLESQASLLTTNSHCEDELRSQISTLSNSLKTAELTLTNIQNEKDGQKAEILSLKVKSEHLQSTIAQLTAKHDSMESMLEVEQRKASSLDLECSSQRDKMREIQEDLHKKTKQAEKLERLMKQQANEVTKANEIIKQLQKELKAAQNKAKLRGQVATEQEKILTTRESELEEVQSTLQELRDRLRAEESRREQGEVQISQLRASLEEAKKTIENNENIISWLNRQISESYTQSWQQRLKSTGITVVPSYMVDKQPPLPSLPPPSQLPLNTSKAGDGGLVVGSKALNGFPVASTFSRLGPISSSGTTVTATTPGTAKPLLLTRIGKENCLGNRLDGTGSSTAVTASAAIASMPNALNTIASDIADLSVRPPSTPVPMRQQPLYSLTKPPLNSTSATSECGSSLTRAPQSDLQNQHSSLLSAYFPPTPGPA